MKKYLKKCGLNNVIISTARVHVSRGQSPLMKQKKEYASRRIYFNL